MANTNYEKILGALKEHGPLTCAALTEKLPSMQYVSTYLSQMYRAGKLKKAGSYRAAIYSIAPEGARPPAPPPAPQGEETAQERRQQAEAERQTAGGRKAEGERRRLHPRHHSGSLPRVRARRCVPALLAPGEHRDRGPGAGQLRGLT